MKQLKIDSQNNKDIIGVIRELIDYLNTYNAIFIPFLGPINSGKTAIINGIIGKNLLPTGLEECTKRSIIIGYDDVNDENMVISNINLEKKNFFNEDKYFFRKKKNSIIGKGINQVKDTLIGLNNKFPESEKDSFYFIKTKIRLFDELGLDKDMKKMIYLIDFPGFGTGNFFEKDIYKNVMTMCNSFVFVVKNLKINEKNNSIILNNLFYKTKDQANIFSLKDFLNSCLFIINNDKEQTTTDNDLDLGKIQIQEVIKNEIGKENIKLRFFNAEIYSNYTSYYNYFFDLNNLFKNEYKKFQDYNINVFKYPENYITNTKYKTFSEYLIAKIKQKTNSIFSNVKFSNLKESPEIEKHIENIVKQNTYFDIKNDKIKNLAKYIYFSQENIDKLDIFENSGIINFKQVFLEQIYYGNNQIKNQINANIINVFRRLDLFFEEKKEINNFEEKIKKIKSKLLEIPINDWEIDIANNLEKLSKLLDAKNLNELLKEKTYEEIIKDINNDLKLNLLELKRQFQIYVNKKVEIINRLAFEAESDLVNFYKDEYILIPLFQEYYIKYFGDEKKTNLENEMYNNIINSSENLIDILLHKGIIELIKSFFGSKYHISNIIQIIKINYLDCTKNTLIKFSNLIKGYIGDLVDLFDFIWYNFEINFNEDQKNKWSSLKQFYGEKKKEILGENEIIDKIIKANKEVIKE